MKYSQTQLFFKNKVFFYKGSYIYNVYNVKKFVLLINSCVLLLFFVYTATFYSLSNKCPGCRSHDYSVSNSSPIISDSHKFYQRLGTRTWERIKKYQNQ
jgi:hypothetical protein